MSVGCHCSFNFSLLLNGLLLLDFFLIITCSTSSSSDSDCSIIFLTTFFTFGLATDDKHYSYKQQVYIPESYPNHYYNTNMFSPLFLAMSKEKKEEDMLDS